MNFQEAIDFLYAQLPLFSRDGAAAIKIDLGNTYALCEILDNPHKKLKTIHIAGTNGKGSSSHMLAAIFQEAGYKTGLYTSPHLHDFRERIKVNGALCTQSFVIDFVEKIKSYLPIIQPSFFEITVAMAFAYFVEEAVDIAVIETGLGGRLDSTNIISPEVCLITNIGKDHMEFLGDNIAQIAFEKAGIIKKNTPVIISEYLPETRAVFLEKAKKENAPIFFAQDIYGVEKYNYGLNDLSVCIRQKGRSEAINYNLDLNGIYQIKNILGVLEVVKQMQKLGWKIDGQSVLEALENVKMLTGLHGRWELLSENPTIIADVGHNVDGINQIIQQLQLIEFNQLHLIIGFVKDKDVSAALSLLPKNAKYYFTKANTPRALDQAALEILAKEKGLKGNAFENVTFALQTAKQNYQKGDLILVCGSVFLVAEVEV